MQGHIIRTVRYVYQDMSDRSLYSRVRKHAVFLCVITTVDPYFKNFMVRKPAIHGQYKAEEEKAWYNNYKDFM